MTYKELRILNEPYQYSIDDYEKVRDKLVNMFSKLSSAISIYQIGTVNNPGISDLDLVVVFDNSSEKLDHYEDYYNILENRDRYILMHGPFIITKNLFKDMRYFYIPGKFDLLWGAKIDIKEIPHSKLCEQLIAAEFILSTLFAVLRTLETKVMKVRFLLCLLNTLKYDLNVCGLNRVNFRSGWNFVDAITILREKWFDLPERERIEQLIEILLNSRNILLEMLSYINDNLDIAESYSRHEYKRKFGLNNYVTLSKNNNIGFSIIRRYPTFLLTKLPYSKLTDDAIWVLSDYIVKIPYRLFSLLLGNVDSNLKPISEYRNYLLKKYMQFSINKKGFGLLLPGIKTRTPSLNLKWCGLIALRKLFCSYL